MPVNGQEVKIAHYTRSKFNSLTNKDSATIYYVEEPDGKIKQYIGNTHVVSDITKSQVEAVLTGTITTHTHNASALVQNESNRLVTDTEKTTWNNKVDKVTGKGLSTNDYTTTEKNKLSGIATGAQVNVGTNLSQGDRNTTTLRIDSSTGNNLTLPAVTTSLAGLMTSTDKTRLDVLHSLLEEDAANNVVDSINEVLAVFNNYPEGADLVTALSGKVDKVNGKGLSTNDFTTTEKNKLAGIASGAEVNVQSDWKATSGDALILNKPTIPSIPSVMTTAEGNRGTAATQRTISAANLKSIILNHSPAGSRPASDVSTWAKASTKPTYSASEVGALASTHAAKDVTAAKITAWDKGQANIIESIKVNGTAQTITSKAVDITVPTKASDVGALASTHASSGVTSALITSWNRAATHAGNAHAPSNAQKNSDITKAEIDTALKGSGAGSIQLGPDAYASGDYSTALGPWASSRGEKSIAIGQDVSAANKGSVAIGSGTDASGINSIAIGEFAYASGENSIAIGYETGVTEDNVVDFGSERQVRVKETPLKDRDATSKKYVDSKINTISLTPGPKGDPGAAATVSVGTTTTGNPGTNASVTQTGTAQNRTFNFVIPRGATGAPGKDGANGTNGAPGKDGTNATISGATATINNAVGTPGVTVSLGGTSSNRSFKFAFTNLKGVKGDKGDKGEQGIQGPKGDTGGSGGSGADALMRLVAVGQLSTTFYRLNHVVSGYELYDLSNDRDTEITAYNKPGGYTTIIYLKNNVEARALKFSDNGGLNLGTYTGQGFYIRVWVPESGNSEIEIFNDNRVRLKYFEDTGWFISVFAIDTGGGFNDIVWTRDIKVFRGAVRLW